MTESIPRLHDYEDVACYLKITVSLADALIDNYLTVSTDAICNEDVKAILEQNSFNGGKTARARELIQNYQYITDISRVIGERIETAAATIDNLFDKELAEKSVGAKP